MAASPAQMESLRDQAHRLIVKAGEPVHAKALEKMLHIGDGEEKTALGDQLYRSMKGDKRFFKPAKAQGKEALWEVRGRKRLEAEAKPKTASQSTSTEVVKVS